MGWLKKETEQKTSLEYTRIDSKNVSFCVLYAVGAAAVVAVVVVFFGQ